MLPGCGATSRIQAIHRFSPNAGSSQQHCERGLQLRSKFSTLDTWNHAKCWESSMVARLPTKTDTLADVCDGMHPSRQPHAVTCIDQESCCLSALKSQRRATNANQALNSLHSLPFLHFLAATDRSAAWHSAQRGKQHLSRELRKCPEHTEAMQSLAGQAPSATAVPCNAGRALTAQGSITQCRLGCRSSGLCKTSLAGRSS